MEQQIGGGELKRLEVEGEEEHHAETRSANHRQEELQMEVQWQEDRLKTDMNRCVSRALEITDGAHRMTPYSSKRFARWNARMLRGRALSVRQDRHVYFPTL